MGSCWSKKKSEGSKDDLVKVLVTNEHVVGLHEMRKIHSAIRWNKPLSVVKPLLHCQSAVNCVDEKTGNAPIHIAAQNGHIELVQLLKDKGANLNIQNNRGNTALHMSIGYNYYSVSKLLMVSGSDSGIKNHHGFPANVGIQGDKSLAANAIVCASTAKEMMEALELLKKTSVYNMSKVSYVRAGLKLKKLLGPAWTDRLDLEFRNCLHNWKSKM